MSDHGNPELTRSDHVLVTGGSGFVGRYVVRELITAGYTARCLVRDTDKMHGLLAPEQRPRAEVVRGDVFDAKQLDTAAAGCTAAIHLIGIIEEQPGRGVTFERMHLGATRMVLGACTHAGIQRYVHMSAMGTRSGGVSRYHQTKWDAENLVRGSGLEWTIFRPSLIHGPDSAFMRMMKFFCTRPVRVPFMPYFGNGRALIQPISALDVAECFVKSLAMPETIGNTYGLCGRERITWRELYDLCSEAIIGRRRLKVSIPVPLAMLAASTVVPLIPRRLMPYLFNASQVQMSQEDNIADATAVEHTFGIALRDLRTELRHYGAQIP